MHTWRDTTTAAGDLADRCRARFEAHGLATMATLRADGSPRISGIEAFFDDDHLWLGMMPGSRKARDLQRDPRVALHSATIDKEVRQGDARISGRAVETTDPADVAAALAAFARATDGGSPPPGLFHLFRVEVGELVLINPAGDHLDIEVWTPDAGRRLVARA